MKLNYKKIVEKKFETVINGYSPTQVDIYFDKICLDYIEYDKEISRLELELKTLKNENDDINKEIDLLKNENARLTNELKSKEEKNDLKNNEEKNDLKSKETILLKTKSVNLDNK